MNMKEIDREIAEKVMEYVTPTAEDGIEYEFWSPSGLNPDGTITLPVIPKDHWKPSTNIFQAFKVDEQLKKSGWQMHLFSLINDTRVVFYKSFRDWHELKEHDYSVSDSPAMAICLAALKIMKEI